MFSGELHLDIQGATVTDTMTHDVGLAVMPDVDHTAVFRKKLTNGVVTGYAAVLTEGYNDMVLENRFFIDVDRLPWGGDLCRSD